MKKVIITGGRGGGKTLRAAAEHFINSIRWKRQPACGGTTMYAAYYRDRYLAGVQNLGEGWMAWLPPTGKNKPGRYISDQPYASLKTAKIAVVTYYLETLSDLPRLPPAAGDPSDR